jgi:hypothetical protein
VNLLFIWAAKRNTVEAAHIASTTNQVDIGKSKTFCSRIPIISPTAANKSGLVLIIRL